MKRKDKKNLILINLKKKEKPKPIEIITAKGSVYRYLPDGRTQRFKATTGELNEIQDVITFIPPYDLVKEQAPKLYPDIFKGIENKFQYSQLLLEYIYNKDEDRTVKVIDDNNRELFTNSEVENAKRVFLAFIDRKDSKNSFTLPVSKGPKLGYSTYDTRYFKDKDGETFHEKHIGHEVTEIRYNK